MEKKKKDREPLRIAQRLKKLEKTVKKLGKAIEKLVEVLSEYDAYLRRKLEAM